MLPYEWIRPWLFRMDAERAHELTLSLLRWTPSFVWPTPIYQPYTCMGIEFPNRLGLAAGMDKNADYVEALARLGFGFIEVGTVTPKAQIGNPRPRLFRIPQQGSLLNRMGFNNHGVDHLVARLNAHKYRGVLGVNIGKNKETPLATAAEDYLYCLHRVYPYASYIVINISSPNTPELRNLQTPQYLANLLQALKDAQTVAEKKQGRYVPLVVKIAPDESAEQLQSMCQTLLACAMDGVIATNTTVDHSKITEPTLALESGGVSGQLLTSQSTEVIRQLAQQLKGKIPIIGVGGIMSAADAQAKLEAGAALLQVYSGLVYRGPQLIREILATC